LFWKEAVKWLLLFQQFDFASLWFQFTSRDTLKFSQAETPVVVI